MRLDSRLRRKWAVIVAAVGGCALCLLAFDFTVGGLGKPKPEGARPFTSLLRICGGNDLTNRFAELDGSTKYYEIRADRARYRAILFYPRHWTTFFDCYVFEEVDEDAWHLRSVCFIQTSRTGSAEFVPEGTQLNIYSDGFLLESIRSAAEQVRKQRMPP